MDTSIRVLVANHPRLLRELVMSTLSEQAMETSEEVLLEVLRGNALPAKEGVA